MAKAVVQSAFFTVLFLFGGIFAGVAIGNAVFNLLPGHSIASPSGLHITVAALPAFTGFLVGAGAWGVWVHNFAGFKNGVKNRRRMAFAGILGFAPITLVVSLALNFLEPLAVEKLGVYYPIHRIFTFLFVPAAFLIAGVSAWAIGKGLQSNTLALELLWQVGGAAALAFLLVNLIMEAAGWRVGGPNAAERATMLTVMFGGNLAAALAGGAVIGWHLKSNGIRVLASIESA